MSPVIKPIHPDFHPRLETLDPQYKKPSQSVQNSTAPVKEPAQPILAARQGRDDLDLLMSGEWRSIASLADKSASEADMKLVGMLVRIFNGNRRIIEKIWRAAGINSGKMSRPDYVERTISEALKNFTVRDVTGYSGDGSDWREYFPTDADCGEEPEEQPLVEGLLYEDTVDMFSGGVGHLKTWGCLSLSRSLIYCEPVFGHYRVPKSVPVLYLCPEMSRKKLRKRMKMFGLDKESLKAAGIPDDMFRFRTFKEGDVIPLTDPRTIEAAKGRVVILDTGGYFADIKDENQAAEFKKLSVPCRQLIAAGCRAVIIVHHSTKVAVEHDVMTLESFVKGSYQIAGLLDDCYGFLIVDERQGLLYVKCIKPRSFEEKFAFVLAYRDEDRASLLTQGRMKMLVEPKGCLELKDIKDAIRGNPKAAADQRKQELAVECTKDSLTHRQARAKFKEAGLKISDRKLLELMRAPF